LKKLPILDIIVRNVSVDSVQDVSPDSIATIEALRDLLCNYSSLPLDWEVPYRLQIFGRKVGKIHKE